MKHWQAILAVATNELRKNDYKNRGSQAARTWLESRRLPEAAFTSACLRHFARLTRLIPRWQDNT